MTGSILLQAFSFVNTFWHENLASGKIWEIQTCDRLKSGLALLFPPLGSISIALKSGNRDIKELTAHMILVIICEISQEEAKEEVFYETYLATKAHSAQT